MGEEIPQRRRDSKTDTMLLHFAKSLYNGKFADSLGLCLSWTSSHVCGFTYKGNPILQFPAEYC
jgi:hypothetical protein